jgi:hypothetical protein
LPPRRRRLLVLYCLPRLVWPLRSPLAFRCVFLGLAGGRLEGRAKPAPSCVRGTVLFLSSMCHIRCRAGAGTVWLPRTVTAALWPCSVWRCCGVTCSGRAGSGFVFLVCPYAGRAYKKYRCLEPSGSGCADCHTCSRGHAWFASRVSCLWEGRGWRCAAALGRACMRWGDVVNRQASRGGRSAVVVVVTSDPKRRRSILLRKA